MIYINYEENSNVLFIPFVIAMYPERIVNEHKQT